jgi:hypothetical protein
MIGRIRTALVTSYSGAVLTGWILANGVLSGVGIFLLPVYQLATREINRQHSALRGGFTGSGTEPIFDWVQLGVGVLKAVLILGAGLLLLHWLYMPAIVNEELPEQEEEPPIS